MVSNIRQRTLVPSWQVSFHGRVLPASASVKRSGRPRLRPQGAGLVSHEKFLIRNCSAMTLLDQSDLQAWRFSISVGDRFGSPCWMFVVLGVRIPLLQVAQWQFARWLPSRRWRDPPTPGHPRAFPPSPVSTARSAGRTGGAGERHPRPRLPLPPPRPTTTLIRIGRCRTRLTGVAASGTRDTGGSRIPRTHAARCQQRRLSP